MPTPAGIVSTREVVRRWRDSVEGQVAIRGNLYYIAPGTTAIKVARRVVTPSDNHDGLTPFTPLATINEFLTNRVVSNEGDVGVLMKEGTYTLSANVANNKHDYGLMAAPGLHHQDVSVVGIAGAVPLDLRGNRLKLRGFSINSGDATYGDLIIGGDYCQLLDMALDSGASVVPAWGLKVMIPISSQADGTARYLKVIGCRVADCVRGIMFDHQQGMNAEQIWGTQILGCWFHGNTTRDIDQNDVVIPGTSAINRLNGCLIARNTFAQLALADFMTLANSGNGDVMINHITDNDFAHNAVTATQVVLTNTSTAFKFTGNKDKAGFITGV